jgi:tetratricopeptide (TPR) repeat protein
VGKRFLIFVVLVLVLLGAAGAWCYEKVQDQAVVDQDWPVRLNPKSANSLKIRDRALREANKYDLIIKTQDEAIRLDSNNALAFLRRGNAWCNKKEYDRALKDYEETMRLDPKYPSGYNALAWLKATCPEEKYRDGEKAIELATDACDLTAWMDSLILDTLAAAYAEAGNFEMAVKYQKQVVLDIPDVQQTYGAEARARLNLYEAKKPYRDTK